MTSIIVSFKQSEETGMDFDIRFGQEGEPTTEEKAAAVFFMPYVKKAVEDGIKEAEERTKLAEEKKKEGSESKVQDSIDGGPSIITLD